MSAGVFSFGTLEPLATVRYLRIAAGNTQLVEQLIWFQLVDAGRPARPTPFLGTLFFDLATSAVALMLRPRRDSSVGRATDS